MALFDLVNFLDVNLCNELQPVLRLVGYVVLAVKIVVPIILIIVGMFDLAKASTEKKEDDIKKAEQGLVSKSIAAVAVFLVVTLVGVLMKIVGAEKYKDCMDCINHPSQCDPGEDYGNN